MFDPDEAVARGSFKYEGEALRAVAMPLGGLGCGSVAICGDGGLRQWQIFNNINHLAHLPHSFFALRVESAVRDPVARILMSDALYHDEGFDAPETSNDHVVPEGSRELLAAFPGVDEIKFIGEYPLAQVQFRDEELPIEVSLKAFSPFIPLNAPDSGLPIVFFTFTVRNPKDAPQKVQLLATLQNAVGWDGIRPIDGVSNHGYGGNRNRHHRIGETAGVLLENIRLDVDHPQYGEMALWSLSDPRVCTTWVDRSVFLEEFFFRGGLPPAISEDVSPDGSTWNAALLEEIHLEGGKSLDVTFLLAWNFPNRIVDWDQWWAKKQGLTEEQLRGKVGNFYASRFAHLEDVIAYSIEHCERLTSETDDFHRAFFSSTLPREILDAVSANVSVLRSPTCEWFADGSFHGFEGCQGKSTPGGEGVGGCCPFDCTHVWNYEMTLAHLFPALERTMRDTEFDVQLDPAGILPHRTTIPLEAPRPWDGAVIGGPDKPALDGELGAILKTYRELRNGAPQSWFDHHWPALRRLFNHTGKAHDPDMDGLIVGDQPNTYDISIFGANSFIGTLYLAALRAMEEMARRRGEGALADECRERFERGRTKLKQRTWNGEYFFQDVHLEQHPEQQWGIGCHADQLLGQWWAHALDLGYVLEPADIRKALSSIRKYNLREGTFQPGEKTRHFADGDERGLLNCTWPLGGRPEIPTNYSDEVWTGIEYEVAALMLFEGMDEDALSVVKDVRHRYDGRRRNPWNEIECGDHYVRGMSSWTLLQAAGGFQYHAWDRVLKFSPRLTPEDFSAFFITSTGWGRISQETRQDKCQVDVQVVWGELELVSVVLGPENDEIQEVEARIAGDQMEIRAWETSPEGLRVIFPSQVEVSFGETLEIIISKKKT